MTRTTSTQSNKRCLMCDNQNTQVSRKRTELKYKNELFIVEYELTTCDNCEEDYLTGKQSQELTASLVREYKKRHGLLSGKEMREIRTKLGLSQPEMEKLLGIGKNTIIRYERELMPHKETIDRDYRILALADSCWDLVLRFFPSLRTSLPHTSFSYDMGKPEAAKKSLLIDLSLRNEPIMLKGSHELKDGLAA